MANINQKLTHLLQQNFKGCVVELENAGAGRVGGFVIWNGFGNKQQIERQQILWALIRKKLPREHQLKIATLLTLTPSEMSAARAG